MVERTSSIAIQGIGDVAEEVEEDEEAIERVQGENMKGIGHTRD